MHGCLPSGRSPNQSRPSPPEQEDRAGPVQAASAPTSHKLEVGLQPQAMYVVCDLLPHL